MVSNFKKTYLFVFALIALAALHLSYTRYSGPNNYLYSFVFKSQRREQVQQSEKQYTKNINELFKIVHGQDPHIALMELQHRMDTDPYVFKNCHSMAHEIGREAYKKYNDFAAALKYQDITCSDGYLHGVIEGRFARVADIFKDMKSVCNNYGIEADRCYHGVGHGVMYYTSNDLPKSLTICGTTYQNIPRKRCYEGVFMENFLSGSNLHPSKYLNPDNPMYPCPQEKEDYKGFCYFYAPYYFLRLNNYDYKAAIKWCNTAESNYIYTCIRGVGSLAMKFNIRDPKYVESLCNTITTAKLERACIYGMASYYFTFWDNLSKVRQMCSTLEEKNRLICDIYVSSKERRPVD